jgi:UDP-N-acetylglucosamine 1-carboxyvinyltransferase
MAEVFEVQGGKKLSGEIDVRGTKNGTLAILPACLLSSEPSIIKNVPLLSDVMAMLELIKSLGATVEWLDQRTVKIQAKDLKNKPDDTLVRKIRASILLAGPVLGRLGQLEIAKPGGCHIGERGLDAHLEGFGDVGIMAEKDDHQNTFYHLKVADKLKPTKIVLGEFSVTATENLMMLLATVEGQSEIHMAAAEPHIQELGEFLIQMGAEISGLGTHIIKIKGTEILKGVEHTIWPDYIEAGTFFALAGATKSNFKINNVPSDYLEMVFRNLKKMGVLYTIEGNSALIKGGDSTLKATKIQTFPYPGFPTDLQAPFSVLCTQAQGQSLIFDTLFEGRFKYADELVSMGARVTFCDPHRILIDGPTDLSGSKMKSCDLRAGATLIIAALTANGKSIILSANEVDRGYEKIEERFQGIGADIKRVNLE